MACKGALSNTTVQVRISNGKFWWKNASIDLSDITEVVKGPANSGRKENSDGSKTQASESNRTITLVTSKRGSLEFKASSGVEYDEWAEGLRIASWSALHPKLPYPFVLTDEAFARMQTMFTQLITEMKSCAPDILGHMILLGAAPRIKDSVGHSLFPIIASYAQTLPVSLWEEEGLRYLAAQVNSCSSPGDEAWMCARVVEFLNQIADAGVAPAVGRELLELLRADCALGIASVPVLEACFKVWTDKHLARSGKGVYLDTFFGLYS